MDTEDDEEFYVCPVCGYEDHADKFGLYCPKCNVNLDDVEEDMK